MSKENLEKKLNDIELILKHLLAIELYKNDVNQADIGKHLSIAKASVNKLLKGIKIKK
jgi:predicted transcriptional regulator